MLKALMPKVLWLNQDAASAGGGSSSAQSEATAIEIEGKKYTADDVKNVLAQQAELTKVSQVANKALTAAQRYNVDVDTYVQNAEASFALMNELIQKGVITDTGELVEKKPEKPAIPEVPPSGFIPQQKADAVSLKALQELHSKLSSVEGEVNRLREDNLGLMRLRIGDQLKQQFTELDEDDIARVIATAYSSGSKKPVTEVAKEMVEAKKAWLASQEEKWAKQYGLSLDELKSRRQFIEQGPEGGIGAMFQGKKITFNKGKDPNAVTPRQATQAMFENLNKFGGK